VTDNSGNPLFIRLKMPPKIRRKKKEEEGK